RSLRGARCLVARCPGSRSPGLGSPGLRPPGLPRAHRRRISHPQICPSSDDAFYVCPRQRINSTRLGTWVVVTALSLAACTLGSSRPPFRPARPLLARGRRPSLAGRRLVIPRTLAG